MDLLRRRRAQLGLERPKPVPASALLLRGGLIGGGVFLLACLACLGAYLYGGWMDQRQRELQDSEQQYDQFQAQIATTNAKLTALKTSNQGLADGIAGITSGSALLAEISALTPRALQLTKLSQQGTSLTLTGLVNQPLGLQLINAFQLRLQDSSLFQPEGVNLVKASEAADTTAAPGAPSQPSQAAASVTSTGSALPIQKPLAFEMTAQFAPDAARKTLGRLQGLGALGLARRIAVLQREGLLP